MQIRRVGDQIHNTNFGNIYAGGVLSKQQEKIAHSLALEFKKNKNLINCNTLEKYYKNKGYDFVIRPFGDKFVTLDAYKWLKIEKSGNEKIADFENAKRRYIGEYDESKIGNLFNDLLRSFSIIG